MSLKGKKYGRRTNLVDEQPGNLLQIRSDVILSHGIGTESVTQEPEGTRIKDFLNEPTTPKFMWKKVG